jgi:TetR/AcrR family transcriptional repressor of nem operon
MSKGSETRREIIRRSAPIFNQKGFAGTALSDLMEATGLEKGGIYRHFSSKEQLASEAFDFTWDLAVRTRLEGTEDIANTVDRLKKMVRNFVERRAGLVPGGCPILNTAIESDDGNRVLRERARNALSEWSARIEKVVAEGKKKSEVRREIEPRKISALIISTLEGALMASRLLQEKQPLIWACDHLESYLDKEVRAGKAA